MLAKPVVDPSEPPDEMNGIPITLDTERRRAVCIDLHSLDGRRNGVGGVRLAVPRDGAALRAEAGGRVLASIDTATFEVTKPAREVEEAPRQTRVPRLLLVLAASALVTAGVVRLMRKPVSTSKT